jgi:negative regulator of flagellin synthesis FlgM
MSYSNGIGNLQQVLSSITPATSQPVESTDTAKPNHASTARAVPTDQTNLSSTGGMIAQALQGSDTRQDKIAALQKTIASGSYNVSSSDVAGKMIDSLLE